MRARGTGAAAATPATQGKQIARLNLCSKVSGVTFSIDKMKEMQAR